MIVPMKKMCLVVQNKDSKEAIEKLRDVGVAHIVRTGADSDGLTKAHEHKMQVENAIGVIQHYEVPKKNLSSDGPVNYERRTKLTGRRGRRSTDQCSSEEHEPYSLDAVQAPVRPKLVDLMLEMGEESKMLEEQITFIGRECERITAWGEFDPEAVKELASLGCPVYLYEIAHDALAQLPKDVDYIKVKVSSDKVFARILVLQNVIPGMTPFQLPEKSLSALEAELSALKERQEKLNERIKSFADRRPVLLDEMLEAENEIIFEETFAELENVEGVPPALGVSWLQGYIPVDNIEKLKTAAQENNWALSLYDPAPEENPPTKLKNKPSVEIIKPLFSFLGTVPGYKEFDISPSYLFFFSIFFAMIFGDAAYGLIILAISAALGIKFIKQGNKLPDIVKLLTLLGSCTVIWGAINGSWFQIPYEHLPFFLQALVIPQFNSAVPFVEFPRFLQHIFVLPDVLPEGNDKVFWSIQFLCFSIAVIQLTYARFKRFTSLLPSLSAIAQLGWLSLMVGIFFIALNMMLGMALKPFVVWIIGAGLGVILVFGNQTGGNFFLNIAKGFGGFFQLFLKAISCFADIISYIRLFAVGLAGAMIAQIFNGLAIPDDGFGGFGLGFLIRLLITVLVLIIGHSLNFVLTCMSVIVHGVRLNLLEYAGNHLEMGWTGYEYKPFALKQKNKQ